MTALPPVVVVKILVESLVPRTRVTGALSCAEKTISVRDRSTAQCMGRQTDGERNRINSSQGIGRQCIDIPASRISPID